MIQCSGVCDLKLMIFKVTYSSTLLVMHAYMSQIFKLVVYMPHTNQQSTCHTQISSLHATHKLVVYMPHTNQWFTCHTQSSSLHATHKLVVYMPHKNQQFTCHIQISSLHATHKLVVYMPHTIFCLHATNKLSQPMLIYLLVHVYRYSLHQTIELLLMYYIWCITCTPTGTYFTQTRYSSIKNKQVIRFVHIKSSVCLFK